MTPSPASEWQRLDWKCDKCGITGIRMYDPAFHTEAEAAVMSIMNHLLNCRQNLIGKEERKALNGPE